MKLWQNREKTIPVINTKEPAIVIVTSSGYDLHRFDYPGIEEGYTASVDLPLEARAEVREYLARRYDIDLG